MEILPNPQVRKLESLMRAAAAGRRQAERGTLFCSRAGMALVNAAFELFECDGLYDLAVDVAQEIGMDREGWPLDACGERLP